jgi:predicted dehydrogenase
MARKVKWGVLGVAKIAVTEVIPPMQNSEFCDIVAIGSRDLSRAQAAAQDLGIAKAYGSYEELLADPEIEAIYNPLPNHLHVPWSIRAAEAGKHVLCEKPIALSVAEAEQLVAVRDRTGVKIEEAFMVRTYPQWLGVKELVDSGRIGEVRSVLGHFSYFNNDPQNIRSRVDYGGGGLMDIGCYPITTSRFVLEEEPTRVVSLMERDPELKIDRLTSAILDFPTAQVIFTCSTQMVPYQRMHFLGTRGRIEVVIPFNAPNDEPCRILVDDQGDLPDEEVEILEFATCDQYGIQGDLFSKAILQQTEVPTPLEDAVKNMAVIEAIFRSADSQQWEAVS